MSQGICFFAYNNSQLDYVQLAILAATYARKFLKKDICLITDQATIDWAIESIGEDVLLEYFDEIVVTPESHQTSGNTRVHFDSPWSKFECDFKNSNKHRIYEYSPYDQTLLLDTDYIVQSDALSYVFDTDDAVLLHHDAMYVDCRPVHDNERMIHRLGIDMKWSTVVYFDKTQDLAKTFFDTWEHIAMQYEFYTLLYELPGDVFRTDYCVSIACHILNGMGSGSHIGDFVHGPLRNMSQKDDIVQIISSTEITYLVNDAEENWKNVLATIKDTDMHCMNKRSLGRMYDDMMKAIK